MLLTLSVPPYGFWPLAMVGFAILFWRLAGLDWRARLLAGAFAGLGLFGPGIFWINEFQQFGYVALVLLELSFVAVAGLLTPPRHGRAIGFAVAVLLAEASRDRVPFGGFPLGGVVLGQVSGPLAPAARIGGPLLILGLTAAVGVAVFELVRRQWAKPTAIVVLAALAVVAGRHDHSTHADAPLRVAVVQGGGTRGLRAVFSDPDVVFQRHLAASELVGVPVDLVVWPEDVIDLDTTLAGSPQQAAMANLASRLHTTVVGGIVEDAGPDHFRNASVVWGPDGTIVGRYDKVHRVPFGEYIPGRSFIAHIADLSIIPRDAIPGRGAGLVRTPAGRLGIMISYEVFFSDRARAAVRAGADILLVPTNAASYKTSQVPTQELSAARLRAIETGRVVVQAGPTGYSAIIDDRGHVVTRTTLGRQEVRQGTVLRRHGLTPYARTGDGPVVALAVVALGGAWMVTRRRPDDGDLDRTV